MLKSHFNKYVFKNNEGFKKTNMFAFDRNVIVAGQMSFPSQRRAIHCVIQKGGWHFWNFTLLCLLLMSICVHL